MFVLKSIYLRLDITALPLLSGEAVGVADPLIQQAESDPRDLHERRHDGELRPGGGGGADAGDAGGGV